MLTTINYVKLHKLATVRLQLQVGGEIFMKVRLAERNKETHLFLRFTVQQLESLAQ